MSDVNELSIEQLEAFEKVLEGVHLDLDKGLPRIEYGSIFRELVAARQAATAPREVSEEEVEVLANRLLIWRRTNGRPEQAEPDETRFLSPIDIQEARAILLAAQSRPR